jgi:transcriptional regulator GlxA family with amidase domain
MYMKRKTTQHLSDRFAKNRTTSASSSMLPDDAGFTTNDLPELDKEWVQLAEELSLTNVATGMVKRHKLLMRMYYGQENHKPISRKRPQSIKRKLSIPSLINPDNLKGQLKHLFEEEQIFLRDELTISNLAHEIGIEPHHLSRFLNIYLHTTFHNLVNTYRVNNAATMLISYPKISIIDIAFASGFNSKASFNRIFKKTTGSTPRQYRHATDSPHSKD